MNFGARIIRGFMWLLSRLPLSFHYKACGVLSWIVRDVIRYRRDLVMTNLARSFPDKKYKELKEIMKRFYQHFGDIVAEAIWFGGSSDERLKKQHLVEFTNIEVAEEAFQDRPGVILMSSHAGNWEILTGFESYDYREHPTGLVNAHNLVVLYKTLSSKVWDQVMRENRCAPIADKGFEGYVSSTQILRYALNHKDEKKLYFFPTDQCPYRNSTADDTVEFMHQKAKTMLGGASIAHKYGFAVLYMDLVQVSRGHHLWTFTEICRDASQTTPHEIMQQFYHLLEADLERDPWNYLWTHNRWKK